LKKSIHLLAQQLEGQLQKYEYIKEKSQLHTMYISRTQEKNVKYITKVKRQI